MKLDILGLQINSPLANPSAANFRPPSWPPPPDWAPILDANGKPQCRYADSSWPLDVWAGSPLKINFGDGVTKGARLSSANADLLRQCALWFLWGPRGCRTATSFNQKVATIKSLFVACTRQGIVASELTRFERVIDDIAKITPPSNFRHLLVILHEILDARDELGFCILDREGIARLARLAPSHHPRQTPYMPPRIWSYQINRTRECLDDFLAHNHQITECFKFCLDAYSNNYGSLQKAVSSKCNPSLAPFQNKKSRKKIHYHGNFEHTADRFGITKLIEKWVAPLNEKKRIYNLSQYLDIVSYAAIIYIASFSLMRIDEAINLRSDCLFTEKDEEFGDIYILCGQTTKTDSDADARWPTSKSTKVAIEALKNIAALRMSCAMERDDLGITELDILNPYLISYQYEPWSNGKHKPYSTRPAFRNYQQIINDYQKLFEPEKIIITEEDLRIARLLTPELDEDAFSIGTCWRFGFHQLRRTGAVNMMTSSMVDESSLQLLLKHQSRVMTLYYARNHHRLVLNGEARTIFLNAMYQEIGRDLRSLSASNFISPLGSSRKESIVKLITESDASHLEKAARQGKVGVRRIRAGFCVNSRPCSYGGVEAISHCVGKMDQKGCPDVLLDAAKRSEMQLYEKAIEDQLRVVPPTSPRYTSLLSEKEAIGKYNEIIRPKRS